MVNHTQGIITVEHQRHRYALPCCSLGSSHLIRSDGGTNFLGIFGPNGEAANRYTWSLLSQKQVLVQFGYE